MQAHKGVATEEGLSAIFLGLKERLSRAVSRIVQPSDVEDIVQETFLKCYEASARSDIRHPKSFMFTTAKNLALNHVSRADNRLVTGLSSFDEGAVPLFGAVACGNEYESHEEFLLICRAVRTLPVQCRRAFILKKVYGYSRKEIATYMGIAESTVQKHVTKGLVMCADYLDKMRENDTDQSTEASTRTETSPLKERRGQ